MTKARDLADFISTGAGTGILADGAIDVAEISDLTASAAEINKLDGLTASTTELNKLTGLTPSTTELNKLTGLTSSTTELNKLTGLTSSTAELNNVAGINSSVQTQLDGKQAVVSGVSSTEIGYLNGVTSNLQTQLGAKASATDLSTAIAGLGTASALDVGTGANQVVQLDGSGQLPALNASNLTGIDGVSAAALLKYGAL